MTTATLSSKGQITIPAQVRNSLGVDTGDRVEFVAIGQNRFELVAATLPMSGLKGLIQKPAAPVSLAAMNAAIKQQAAKAER